MGMAMKTPSIAMGVIQKKMVQPEMTVCVASMSAGIAATVPPPVM